MPTGKSPFNLVYGTETLIPVEVGLPSERLKNFSEAYNDRELGINLDLIEETRELANIRRAPYQRRVTKYYNSKVQLKSFKRGDLVLRKAEVSDPRGKGKLSANWEGPYKISEVVKPGAYRLKDLGGKDIKRAWNAEHLKKFF